MPDDHNMLPADTPTTSESFRSAPHDSSESVGTVPNVSERNTPSLPKASEAFGNTPSSVSETMDDVLYRPPRQAVHTLTVREVEKLFEQAGSPVTERSILNWCKPNREGVCRLQCGYERGEYRWYIAPDSVERVIEEERKKQHPFPKDSLEFSEVSDRLSETFGREPDGVSEGVGTIPPASETQEHFFPKRAEARDVPRVSHETDAGLPSVNAEEVDAIQRERDSLQQRVRELEREAAAGQYKDELITSLKDRVQEDRREYSERMQFFQNQVEKLQTTTTRYVDELVGINRRVGQLEAENRSLRQLPAGRYETREVDDGDQPHPEESQREGDQGAYRPPVSP
jgi:hypothetical protein